MTTESRTRVLQTTVRDGVKWLQYERGGKPAELRVSELRSLLPYGDDASTINDTLCDSTTAEVLAALGWDRMEAEPTLWAIERMQHPDRQYAICKACAAVVYRDNDDQSWGQSRFNIQDIEGDLPDTLCGACNQ